MRMSLKNKQKRKINREKDMTASSAACFPQITCGGNFEEVYNKTVAL